MHGSSSPISREVLTQSGTGEDTDGKQHVAAVSTSDQEANHSRGPVQIRVRAATQYNARLNPAPACQAFACRYVFASQHHLSKRCG